MNDQLMREVQDDIRRERMQRLWVQYRAPLLAAVAALVIAVAGMSYWQDYRTGKAEQAMLRISSAIRELQTGDAAKAATALQAQAEASTGEPRDVALLWLARAQAKAGDVAAASKSLGRLATAPQGADLIWRDLGCLQLLQGADAPAACTADSASPLREKRMEAHAAQLAASDKHDEARAVLTALRDAQDAAPTTRERAGRLLSAIPAGTAAPAEAK
jgi:hypothetical protein